MEKAKGPFFENYWTMIVRTRYVLQHEESVCTATGTTAFESCFFKDICILKVFLFSQGTSLSILHFLASNDIYYIQWLPLKIQTLALY